MNEIGRIAAGLLLVAMAVLLATGLDFAGAQQKPEAAGQLANAPAPANPDWQAMSRAANPLAVMNDNANQPVRPRFDPPTDEAAETKPELTTIENPFRDTPGNSIPRFDDRYRALAPFLVGGAQQAGQSLVPVQPKRGFSNDLRIGKQTHVVRPGDSLQSIASQYYGSAARYLDIYLANKHVLTNPARIPDGIELRIPR